MKIALVHATTTAVDPIVRAFHAISAEVELLHLMDTGLFSLLEENGMTPGIRRRFAHLLELAAQSNADCIQLTCSAFNDLARQLQPFHHVRIFRSDEAMLDEALNYERIGLISTVRHTPDPLIRYLQRKRPGVQVESLLEPGLIRLLFEGKNELHDEWIRRMIRQLEPRVDVIVLSQYSMAHVAEQVIPAVPLLTAPAASAKRCMACLASKM